MRCRHCQSVLNFKVLDLGAAPPSNAYLTLAQISAEEKIFPLRLLVCKQCWLVQTEDYAAQETLFTDDYAYLSSVSRTWLKHAEKYVTEMIERFSLTTNSTVVEVAANDGYLLQYVKRKFIPCYGIEPTRSAASLAKAKGIEIVQDFFSESLAQSLSQQRGLADLIIANNVLAHVPDINDFSAAISMLLKPEGVATFEFQYLVRMVQQIEFDTAYHEHYSYLSLSTVLRIFDKAGLQVFDVQELPTHGGSLRVFVQRIDSMPYAVFPSVRRMLDAEIKVGVETASFYSGFQEAAEHVKIELLCFLIQAKKQGKKVAAYGAAAKGNTLINFAGIKPDLLPFVADASPTKQGKYLPGSRIPIYSPKDLLDYEPNYVIILPWNISEEIKAQLAGIQNWGGTFVTAIPELKIMVA